MLLTTIIGYIVSLVFFLAYVGTSQLGTLDSESVAMLYALIFVGIFDAPHIFHTLIRTHYDPRERSRRLIMHMVAPIGAVGIALASWQLGYEGDFIMLLGLYGGWHITRQNVGFARYLSTKPLNRVPEWFIYSIYGYFLFHNSESSGDLWGAFLPGNSLSYLQIGSSLFLMVAMGLFIFQFRNLGRNVRWFTLVTAGYFLWLTHAHIHPLLITAMATIAHNIQYQVWMWWYERKSFNRWLAPVALFIFVLIGVFVAAVPDEGAWGIVGRIYGGFILWHYFIDGYIWRFREAPELKVMNGRP